MADAEDPVEGFPEDKLEEQPLSAEAQADVRTLAKGGGVQAVGQFAQQGLSFIFSAVAVRILGAAGYGLYRAVAQLLTNLSQVGLAGFNYAAMRFITMARAKKEPGGVRGAARVSLVATAIASSIVVVGVLVFAAPIARVFSHHSGDPARFAFLLRVGIAFVPLFALMQVLRYCTQAYKTLVPSVIVGNIIQPGIRFVVGVSLLAAGFAVTGALLSLVISAGVGAVAGAFYFRKMLTQAERDARVEARPGPMTRFALPQMAASLLGVQTLGLGILALKILSTNRQVGLFAVALALQAPGNLFLGSIVNIWAPVVSDLYERGAIERLEDLYQTVNRWVATLSFPIFAALMIAPELFVRLFAGRAGSGAAIVVTLLAIGNLFYVGTGPTGYVLSMTGRPGINAINSATGVAIYIALAAVVAPHHGAAGMAIVDSSVTALVNIARVVEAKLLVGVQPFGKRFLKPVWATLAGAAVLLGDKLAFGTGALVEIAGLALAGIVYVGVLAKLGIDPEERHVFETIKRRAFKRGGNAKASDG